MAVSKEEESDGAPGRTLGTAFLSQSVRYRLVLTHGDTFGPRRVPHFVVKTGSCGLEERSQHRCIITGLRSPS